ncbi:MAG: DUF3467 domain-containing protein [Pirellula sp.]|jgi:hypothetical protein
MAFPINPDDRSDPMENMPAVRARIPEHVARGEISTGVIVVTGGTEFLLDFVRNLPRPSCVVARVVLPHLVMPQFIDALTTNMELFKQRYGELPGVPSPIVNAPAPAVSPSSDTETSNDTVASQTSVGAGAESNVQNSADAAPKSNATSDTPSPFEANSIDVHPGAAAPVPANPNQNANSPRRQNPQEVYDELKLRDEILSGSYANAVMIGHGPFEFSFDFITNFYPQSAVSCRVYMASGHVARLLDSLKASWEQIRGRYGFPPKP